MLLVYAFMVLKRCKFLVLVVLMNRKYTVLFFFPWSANYQSETVRRKWKIQISCLFFILFIPVKNVPFTIADRDLLIRLFLVNTRSVWGEIGESRKKANHDLIFSQLVGAFPYLSVNCPKILSRWSFSRLDTQNWLRKQITILTD